MHVLLKLNKKRKDFRKEVAPKEEKKEITTASPLEKAKVDNNYVHERGFLPPVTIPTEKYEGNKPHGKTASWSLSPLCPPKGPW